MVDKLTKKTKYVDNFVFPLFLRNNDCIFIDTRLETHYNDEHAYIKEEMKRGEGGLSAIVPGAAGRAAVQGQNSEAHGR